VPLSRTALYAAAAASDTPLRGMLLEQYA
jgi:hypothetical protein